MMALVMFVSEVTDIFTWWNQGKITGDTAMGFIQDALINLRSTIRS